MHSRVLWKIVQPLPIFSVPYKWFWMLLWCVSNWHHVHRFHKSLWYVRSQYSTTETFEISHSHALISLFQSYLINRYVECCGQCSWIIYAKLDIPQGSKLGPLSLNIFLNDIIVGLNAQWLLYADDLKISKVIKADRDSLNSLYVWCALKAISTLMHLGVLL